MKVMKTALIVFLLFLASNSYAVTVSYYQGDGKGTVSDTDGREVTTSGIAGPNTSVFYAQGSTHCIYIGFFNIFGSDEYQIKEGSTITSATLKLVKITGGDSGVSGTLYKANSAWTESTLSWATKPSASTLLSFHYGYNVNLPRLFDVTYLVQTWADDPSKNYGWMVTAAEYDGDMCQFASDDYSKALYRPTLTITYDAPPEPEPVPEPATLILFGAGLAGIVRRLKK